MKQIYPHLYIGNDMDYMHVDLQGGWAVVHAARDPYHRLALGLEARAGKEHPEYLFALRGDELCLNLVDAADPKYVSDVIVDTALRFIDQHLSSGREVLIHCNMGRSRSPTIGLAYLGYDHIAPEDYEKALDAFRILYPDYWPSLGMKGYLEQNWVRICQMKTAKNC